MKKIEKIIHNMAFWNDVNYAEMYTFRHNYEFGKSNKNSADFS